MVSVVMIGASGAVGGHALNRLLDMPEISKVTILVRRKVEVESRKLFQHVVDLESPSSYSALIAGHQIAICTLGVGQPSKVTREEFQKIDHDVPLAFATACRKARVGRFVLLASVGADAKSRSYYLRGKGALEDGLRALNFHGLSLIHPSMILTPENRYGWSQGLMLAVWPKLNPLLSGRLRKFRGVTVEVLGRAVAQSTTVASEGEEMLEWDSIRRRATS